jgi:methyl-accepting chemotaxis protein
VSAGEASALGRFTTVRWKVGASLAGLLAVVVLIAAVLFPARMEASGQRWMERRASAVAAVLAHSIAPGLEFDSIKLVDEPLQALQAMDTVAYALVLRPDGSRMTGFQIENAPEEIALQDAAETITRDDDVLHLVRAIALPGGDRGALALGVSLEEVHRESATNLKLVLLVGAFSLAFSILLAFLLGSIIGRPVARLSVVARRVVELGDLTDVPAAETRDEIGDLAGAFAGMMVRLRNVLSRVRQLTGRLDEAGRRLEATGDAVMHGASSVATSARQTTEATASSLDGIRAITARADELFESATGSTATVEALSTANREVAVNAEEMAKAADLNARGSEQMAGWIHDVADRTGELDDALAGTSASVGQLGQAIAEIEKRATQTLELAERASSDARSGVEAIDRTIDGIGNIRDAAQDIDRAMSALTMRLDQVGQILVVIDEVTDRTSLLSLNAAIISAQAGEHGKGFAVVAHEIRDLAVRTRTATREIADVISGVDDLSRRVNLAVMSGVRSVEEGAGLARGAAHALEQIRASSESSTEAARAIADATQTQTREAQSLTRNVTAIAQTAAQIGSVTGEQAKASEQVLDAMKRMRDLSRRVHESTEEQARGFAQIERAIERVHDIASTLRTEQASQTSSAEAALEAVQQITGVADQQADEVRTLEGVIAELRHEAEALQGEIRAFRT